MGYVGSTLAQIASRADVSPGLVAHYFDDKDGLLEAAFRTLSRRLFEQMDVRMRQAHTPRGRIQAIIDTNLGPQEFTQRTGSAWLAFWGQVPHVHGLEARSERLPAAHGFQPALCVGAAAARAGSAQPGRHHCGDDRRCLVARGAVQLGGS